MILKAWFVDHKVELLEIQISRPRPGPAESAPLGVGPSHLCFHSLGTMGPLSVCFLLCSALCEMLETEGGTCFGPHAQEVMRGMMGNVLWRCVSRIFWDHGS